MRLLGESEFGAVPLVGIEDGVKTCANGLPVTPASVRMMGRFSMLAALDHPHLCKYIELIRCHLVANTVILVSEVYRRSLLDEIKKGLSYVQKLHVAYQLVSGISYLHGKDVIVGYIDINNILFVPSDLSENVHIRLSQYGLSRVSGNGRDVSCVIGSCFTLSPERLADPQTRNTVSQKSDIWALGIVFLEMIIESPLSSIWSYKQYFNVISLALLKGGESSALYAILAALKSSGKLVKSIEEKTFLFKLAEMCLNKLPSKRPTAEEIENEFLENTDISLEVQKYKCESTKRRLECNKGSTQWMLEELPISEAFFLWKLSGSSVENLLTNHDVIQLKHPITTIPSVIVGDFRSFGNEESRQFHVNYDVFVLPSKNFKEKILSANPKLLLHSFEMDEDNFDSDDNLSVVVKEKDVYYQCSRMKMVAHLVKAVSIKKEILQKMVKYDIPPMARVSVWTVFLNVHLADGWIFNELDTVSAHSSDRQLDVDIPRCHQYEEMMTSPAAHVRLKRLLKAWLRANPNFVYWQGLDSLTAPFLLLNFEDLPMALACLNSFVDKYLLNFFLKENSVVIQEYLAVFNHLVAYVDAELYTCMKDMDFYPELFAIPWFLTCFAHVLPLHKLFHVWDALLLADASFPLFVGLAVLQQLRPRLIGSNFNDAILLFSDLPDLNMEMVIADSIKYYSFVPSSCAYRSQGSDRIKKSSSPTDPRLFSHTMKDIPFLELKKLDCPRMSWEELAWRVERQQVLVIDLRSQPEFNRGSIDMSINYPNLADDSLTSIKNAIDGAQRNRHPICVLDAGKMEMSTKFSSFLVRNHVCGVCILDGGFEGIRHCQQILRVQ